MAVKNKKAQKKVVEARVKATAKKTAKAQKETRAKVTAKKTAKTQKETRAKTIVKKTAKPQKETRAKATAKTVVAKKSSKPVKVLKTQSAKKSALKKTAAPKAVAKKPIAKKSVPVKTAAPVKTKSVPAKKPVVKKNMKAEHKADTLYAQEIFSDVTLKAMQAPPKKKATTLLGSLEFMPYEPKPSEEYMNEHQKVHFRKILDAWKQQLMQDVDLTVGHLKEEAVFYADPVDRAAQEEGFNLELRTRDRERKLIKKIEQSLDLLNTGEYGYCEDCGAEIGIRRLEARPTAVKCIDCKTFQEIREKQLGG